MGLTKMVDSLDMLQAHRERLAKAKSFEEYQAAHLEYIDTLIKRHLADIVDATATISEVEYMEKSAPLNKDPQS